MSRIETMPGPRNFKNISPSRYGLESQEKAKLTSQAGEACRKEIGLPLDQFENDVCQGSPKNLLLPAWAPGKEPQEAPAPFVFIGGAMGAMAGAFVGGVGPANIALSAMGSISAESILAARSSSTSDKKRISDGNDSNETLPLSSSSESGFSIGSGGTLGVKVTDGLSINMNGTLGFSVGGGVIINSDGTLGFSM